VFFCCIIGAISFLGGEYIPAAILYGAGAIYFAITEAAREIKK